MMPKKRYLYIPSGTKPVDAVELVDVRDIEDKRILLSPQLSNPMQYSEASDYRVGEGLRERFPRVIRVDGEKKGISELTPLEWHEQAMYQDTTPNHADAKTLKSLARVLEDEKKRSYFTIVATTKTIKIGDICDALNGRTWGKIGEGVCRLQGSTFDVFQLLVESMRNPVKNSPKWVISDLKGMNKETLDTLSGFCSDIRKERKTKELKDNEILGEVELQKNIKLLGSPLRDRRYEASRKLFHHYQFIRNSVVQTPKDAESSLLKAVDDPDEKIRANVSQTLGFINSHKAIDRITDRIDMAESEIEIVDHMEALKYMNNPRILGIYARLGMNGSAGVREEVVDCMDQILNFGCFKEREMGYAEKILMEIGEKEDDGKVKKKISWVLSKIKDRARRKDDI